MVLSVLLRTESKGYVLWLDSSSLDSYKFSFDSATGFPPLMDGNKVDVPFHYHVKLLEILAQSSVGA
jgi:hypothetical protein